MRFTTARRMANIDRVTIEEHEISETALMETAGLSTARHAKDRFLDDGSGDSAVVACGKGHNGADGLVAARWLDRWNCDVTVLLTDPVEETSELTQKQAVHLQQNDAIALRPHRPDEPLPEADLYVDALLGTGLSGDPRPPYDSVIQSLNRTDRPVVALDVPSGLSGDDPHPFNPCVEAELTVTFGLPKYGLLGEPGYQRVGHLVVQELGFPESAYRTEAGAYHLMTPRDAAAFLPERSTTDHKGDAGRLSVVAGSDPYPGAAFLSSRAASATGAGLTSVIGPDGLNRMQGPGERDLVFPLTRETLLLDEGGVEQSRSFLNDQQAFVVGPGLQQSRDLREGLERLFEALEVPVVVDADGLNNFAGEPESLKLCPTAILTPHPGEAGRLLGCSVSEVQKEPLEALQELGERTGQTVILKTSRPLIRHTDGTVSLNVSGSPALAKAGSGDVLSGILGGLLAQGLPPGPAACLGVYLHGAAGRRASQDRPAITVQSQDLIESLPGAMTTLRMETVPDWFPLSFDSHSERTLSWHPWRN